jgi:hypothetical protein
MAIDTQLHDQPRPVGLIHLLAIVVSEAAAASSPVATPATATLHEIERQIAARAWHTARVVRHECVLRTQRLTR